jgi:hypothetical protein
MVRIFSSLVNACMCFSRSSHAIVAQQAATTLQLWAGVPLRWRLDTAPAALAGAAGATGCAALAVGALHLLLTRLPACFTTGAPAPAVPASAEQPAIRARACRRLGTMRALRAMPYAAARTQTKTVHAAAASCRRDRTP